VETGGLASHICHENYDEGCLIIPANIRLVFLPPHGPALNPIERVCRGLQDDITWQQFPNLEVQQDYAGQLLQAYGTPRLQALTGYTYVVEAINALCL
jgi:hypothetical protein